MRAGGIGIIRYPHTDQTSEQAKCSAQESQRGRHASIQLQALQYAFIGQAAIERPPNEEAELCTPQGGTAVLSILTL